MKSTKFNGRQLVIQGAAMVCAVTVLVSGAVTEVGASTSSKLAAFNAKAEAAVAAASAKETALPPSIGPKGAKNIKIVIIPPAGASTEGGYRVALAAQDAAKALGWHVTFINPNGDPTQMNAAVQQAIAIKAKVIAISSIDAAVVSASVKQAEADGIKVVAAVAANSSGDTGIYNSLTPSLASGQTDGFALAAEAYLKQGHHLRVVEMMDNEFGYVVARQQGWNRFIAQCQAAGGDCKTLATVNFLAADITTSLPSLTASTLRSHPTFNVLWSGFDSGLTFMIEGAKQAGLENKGTIAVGYDGNTVNLASIKAGGWEKATIGLSTLAIGYGMINNANRLLHGLKPLSGTQMAIRNKLITSANVPAGGSWWGDVDVRPTYWKVWGVTPKSPAPASSL